jgi:Common central domain of tyrosinase
MAHRIDLTGIPAADRQQLADLILQYRNDAIVDQHMAIIHSGVEFFIGHRAYIGQLEAWLAANGGAQFVPLPEWDPQRPIPQEFNVVKPQDDGTPRDALQNLAPNVPPPQDFGFPGVCSIGTLAELSDVVNPWHGTVHGTIGGAMGDIMTAPAAPIFWCWHAYLDDIYFDFEVCTHPSDHDRPGKGKDEYERQKQEYRDRMQYWEKKHDEEFPHHWPFRDYEPKQSY